MHINFHEMSKYLRIKFIQTTRNTTKKFLFVEPWSSLLLQNLLLQIENQKVLLVLFDLQLTKKFFCFFFFWSTICVDFSVRPGQRTGDRDCERRRKDWKCVVTVTETNESVKIENCVNVKLFNKSK